VKVVDRVAIGAVRSRREFVLMMRIDGKRVDNDWAFEDVKEGKGEAMNGQ
jgi:hypothetical protein